MTRPTGVRVTGPLAPHAPGFGHHLEMRGYTPLSAANQLRVMAHLSRWLLNHELSPDELTTECVEAFLKARRAGGYTGWVSQRGLAPLLDFLRCQGIVPMSVPAVPDTPMEKLLAGYCTYLADERGLVSATIYNHERIARLFLSERCRAHQGELALEQLTASEVGDFVVAECPRRSVGSAKVLVTGLRSLLRYLHLSGQVGSGLAAAVPAVAGWRGGRLPRALPTAQVQQLLASCDRRRSIGRRDFAILMVLARLGLRAGEAAALELDDIDWHAGEVVVRGKGRRQERLPLPVDVGEAIVGYLGRGRRRSDDRGLFLGVRAPHARASGGAVMGVVHRACDRAGLPRVGAHRLRHSLASEMLRHGGSLAEVGQVLRHRSASTTAIYAKVDRAVLRDLALPWPGTGGGA
jgi:integrase/recombinase XerD